MTIVLGKTHCKPHHLIMVDQTFQLKGQSKRTRFEWFNLRMTKHILITYFNTWIPILCRQSEVFNLPFHTNQERNWALGGEGLCQIRSGSFRVGPIEDSHQLTTPLKVKIPTGSAFHKIVSLESKLKTGPSPRTSWSLRSSSSSHANKGLLKLNAQMFWFLALDHCICKDMSLSIDIIWEIGTSNNWFPANYQPKNWVFHHCQS